MSSNDNVRMGKRPPKFTRRVSVTPSGKVSVKRRRVYVRPKRKRKATFVELFGSILQDNDNWTSEEHNEGPTASGNTKKSSQASCKTYAEKRKASRESWTSQRQKLLSSFVNSELLLEDSVCRMEDCNRLATCRCDDCGIGTYLCTEHVVTSHKKKLHVPSFWKDGTFTPTFIKQDPWVPCHGHQCGTRKERSVVVIDYKGRQHSVPVAFCECWTDAQQLIFMRLWPASPTRPEVGFQWDLMSWLRTMSLECHASLRNLCEAMQWMAPMSLPTMIKNPYSLLSRDSFMEFKYFADQLERLQFLDRNLWKETMHPSCLACPQSGGNRIVSLDAMFGLKRWKKSGDSETPPRYPAHTFFVEQEKVDKFLASYKQDSVQEQSCSSFQAGNAIHTKSTSTKLDETGVFGAVCRHEMPLFFFSLRRGEQLGNAVFLIRYLMEELPTTKHFILYDIACKLHAHLKKTDQTELLSKVQLAIPAFHVYGHKPSCQMEFSTRRVDGFALSDGEQVERLWSYLRNFSGITREMTSSNRSDTLTGALLHYATKREHKLGELILQRYKRAMTSMRTAKEELNDALSMHEKSSPSITETDIKKWITEKQVPSAAQVTSTGIDLSPEETYAIQLSKYYSLCDEISQQESESHHLQILTRKVTSMNVQLIQMETAPRWNRDDAAYQEALLKTEDRKRLSHLNNIHSIAVDRWFLLSMKKKYADGQKIAKRLSIQVKKQSAALTKAVSEYNQLFKIPSSSLPNTITADDAFDVKSRLWECLFPTHAIPANAVPPHAKRLLMDIWHRKQHSKEEVELLKSEMTQMFHSLNEKLGCLSKMLETGSHTTGEKCLILAKKSEFLHRLYFIFSLFHEIVPLPEIEEPAVMQSVTLDDHSPLMEEIDLPLENEEDDEETDLDELIVAINESPYTEDEEYNM